MKACNNTAPIHIKSLSPSPVDPESVGEKGQRLRLTDLAWNI